MPKIDPELKPLRPQQREFIHLIVYQGLSKTEAYAQVHNKTITDENRESVRISAISCFNTPHIKNYYNGLMEEIREREVKKGVWTREVATQKLMRLIEKAEQDIYGDDENAPKQLTMSRLNAIILPAKELNTMNGFNQTNINVDGCVVQICGEGELKD